MNKERQKKYVILMADIVGSSNINGQVVMTAFKKLVSSLNKQYQKMFLTPMTITLGDEFQCVVRNMESAIELIILFEESRIRLKLPFQLRFVVHKGIIETKLNRETSHGMLGPGLTEARVQLNQLKKKGSRFHIETGHDFDVVLNNTAGVLDRLTSAWKNQDSALIQSFLKWKTYQIVAAKLGRDRSNMWRRQASLRMDDYFALVEILKSTSQWMNL